MICPEVDPADDTAEFLDRLFAQSESYLAPDRYASIGNADQFFTKVVGVSFDGRQDVVGGITEGSAIELRRQPDNPFDGNAVGIWCGKLQLGYLRRQIAQKIAPNMDAGEQYAAAIGSVTGGGTRHYGLNISVSRRPDRLEPHDPEPANGTRQSVRDALIGNREMHASQVAVLERIEGGRNTLAVLGTSRGKSLCFALPAAVRALENSQKTVVLYPLRALANDQYESLVRRLGPLGLRILRANGSIDRDERIDLMTALESGQWHIICSTPEFFVYHLERFRTVSRPDLVVIDEAHHLFLSKHRAAYGRIAPALKTLESPQVLALTATADTDVFEHIATTLDIGAWVIDPTVRENLQMVDARGTTNKFAYLLKALAQSTKAIVYCMSRTESAKTAEKLRALIPNVAFYHAGVPTQERTEVERLFRENRLRVVVATSAFGEGIDLPDVRDVFLYHMNFDFTEFNQQSGRAGRDGDPAKIHMLFGEKDRRINDYIIEKAAPTLYTLRQIYKELKALAIGHELRSTYAEIAALLSMDKVDAGTIGAAMRIFADAKLVEFGDDDDGRYIRFLPAPSDKIDLTTNARFAEGEAERENFSRFCEVVTNTAPEVLQNIINRPIYPQSMPLLAG